MVDIAADAGFLRLTYTYDVAIFTYAHLKSHGERDGNTSAYDHYHLAQLAQ